MNVKKNIKFFHVKNIAKNKKKFDFCLVIDVLHHIGLEDNNKIYLNRRDKMLHTLRKIGLEVVTPKAGLYVWAKLPNGWTSAAFTAVLLDELDIVVTPGTGYGKSGEGFIRLSLTTPDDRIDQGLKRLSEWQIPNPVNS